MSVRIRCWTWRAAHWTPSIRFPTNKHCWCVCVKPWPPPTSAFLNVVTSLSSQPITAVTVCKNNALMVWIPSVHSHMDAHKVHKHAHKQRMSMYSRYMYCKQCNVKLHWCWSPTLTPPVKLSLSLSAARPVKDRLDWSNEDVKIKIDFVTESSPRASEWVVARLACHYFSRSL